MNLEKLALAAGVYLSIDIPSPVAGLVVQIPDGNDSVAIAKAAPYYCGALPSYDDCNRYTSCYKCEPSQPYGLLLLRVARCAGGGRLWRLHGLSS